MHPTNEVARKADVTFPIKIFESISDLSNKTYFMCEFGCRVSQKMSDLVMNESFN